MVVHVERLVLIEETMVYSCEQGAVLNHWKEGSSVGIQVLLLDA